MKHFITSAAAITTATLLFQGCAKNQEVAKPTSIKDIEQNKVLDRKKSLRVGYGSGNSFQVFIDENDRVNYICYKGSKNCNYYDIRKHSFKMTTDVKEDVIWMYKNSFSPDFSKNVKDVQCGRGSMTGWLVALPFIELKNHNKSNLKLCYNRFTKVDSMQIGTRIVSGMLTFGTSVVTAGNMHTRKFDEEEFRNAVVDSNLDKYQKELFKLSSKNRLKTGFDVVYIDSGDVEDSLEEVFDRIKYSKASRDGIILVDEDNKKILKTIVFSKYKSKNLIKNISNQIHDILAGVDSSSTKVDVSNSDILKYIPPRIKKPKLPKLPTLVKDEFETKKEFESRVLKAVQKREADIKALQKEYDLEVFSRNEYINSLEKSYENYLKTLAKKSSKLRDELEENIELLAKILFVQNLHGFDAKNFKYDAETQSMYFDIYSNKKYFYQSVVAKIPSDIAKQIKKEKSYKIEPSLEYKAGALVLKNFKVIEPKSKKEYEVRYTNINFKPTKLRVSVKTRSENIKDSQISKEFKAYKQQRSKLRDSSKKEIWYMDVVKRINARVPKWFSNPIQSKEIIAYAEGDSLSEAKATALKELAYMIKVRISSSYEVRKEISGLRSFKQMQRDIKTSTDVEFKADDYKVYKQDSMDGRWYVALVYKGDKK